MFRWFETRLKAFPDDPPERPPETLLAFYLYFVRPVWPAFAVLLVAGFLGSIIEVALMTFVGNLVDLMRQASTPATFISDHGHTLLWMALRRARRAPVVSAVHDLIKNQLISGAGHQPRALADASLRAAPEPELLPERLCRPRRQQGDAGGAGPARVRRAARSTPSGTRACSGSARR